MNRDLAEAVRRAVKRAGGNAALARVLGITPQAISQWDRVPADRVMSVAKASGMTLHELRPDLYPAGEEAVGVGSAPSREGPPRAEIPSETGVGPYHKDEVSSLFGARPSDDAVWAKLGPNGRLAIPGALLQAMGVAPGDDVLLRFEKGELHVSARDAAIQRAREIVRRYVPEGVSLVDELIAERRAEAAREEGGR